MDLGPIKIDFIERGCGVHDIKRLKRIEGGAEADSRPLRPSKSARGDAITFTHLSPKISLSSRSTSLLGWTSEHEF